MVEIQSTWKIRFTPLTLDCVIVTEVFTLAARLN